MNEQEDHEIDITIEAVTGTVYDLCVSPYETILGIKTKIQRLEGIPVYQQHLIYGDIELQDDYCLEEYDICTGCQLKLVIALRGGPVHAHRIQLEDSALLELAEYLDIQSGVEHEQYMLMLLNEDGNLELVNAEDHSQLHSPVEISDSSSQTSLLTTAHQPLRPLAHLENLATKGKMRDVQSKLRELRLNRAEHQVPKKPLKLKRKCTTAKVIILDSCASNGLLVPPSPATPPQPSSCLCTNPPHCYACTWDCQHHCHHCHHCHNISAKTQRKLSFRPSPPTHELNKIKSSRSVSRESCCCKHRLMVDMTPPPVTPQQLRYNPNRCRKLKTPSSKGKGSFLLPSLSSDRHHTDATAPSASRVLPGIATAISRERSLNNKLNTAGSSSNDGHFLPPIINKRPVKDKSSSDFLQQKSMKKNRCMKCGKKTRIAATYTCRCGGWYCGAHRYAEKHSCAFDYKSEGKETIARNNPLVVATKLPKI